MLFSCDWSYPMNLQSHSALSLPSLSFVVKFDCNFPCAITILPSPWTLYDFPWGKLPMNVKCHASLLGTSMLFFLCMNSPNIGRLFTIFPLTSLCFSLSLCIIYCWTSSLCIIYCRISLYVIHLIGWGLNL